MDRKTLLTAFAAVGIFMLTACSSAAPKQIASSPAEQPAEPRSIARDPSHQGEVIPYNADIELTVDDVDTAAGKVTVLAYDLGGAISSSHSWFQDGQKRIDMELSIPADQFDNLRRKLLDIGTLNSAQILNEVVNPDDIRGRTTLATIHLQPATFTIGGLDGAWSPVRTFSSAFNVVASIFRVVVDIAIWIVVVLGPFAIIALGVRFLLRRSRKSNSPPV